MFVFLYVPIQLTASSSFWIDVFSIFGFEYGFHVFFFFCLIFFGILLHLLLISRFAMISLLINGIIMTCFVVFKNEIFDKNEIDSTIDFFSSPSNNDDDSYNNNNEIDRSRLINVDLIMYIWMFLFGQFINMFLSFYLSKNRIQQEASIILLGVLSSTLDFATDGIIIYIWYNAEHYSWAFMQCAILITSQLVVTYFMYNMNGKDAYFVCDNIPKALLHWFELFLSLIGIGRLWFAVKKIFIDAKSSVKKGDIGGIVTRPKRSHSNVELKVSDTNNDSDSGMVSGIGLSPSLHSQPSDGFGQSPVPYQTNPFVFDFYNYNFDSVSNLSIGNNNGDKSDDHDDKMHTVDIYERFKLWELMFESFPTIILSSYVIFSRDIWSTSLIVSMGISFLNLSYTLVRAIKESKHNEYKEKLLNDKNIEKEMKTMVLSPVKPMSVSIDKDPHDNDDEQLDKSFIEKIVQIWKEKSIYLDYYLMIWLFSVTDSYIRMIPYLMLVTFFNANIFGEEYIGVGFVFFCLLYGATFAYEFYVLYKEKIINVHLKKKDKDNDNNNNNSDNNNNDNNNDDEKNNGENHSSGARLTDSANLFKLIIYSFYCVITNALYLLTLIGLKYFNAKQTQKRKSKYFIKYQFLRIGGGLFITGLVALIQFATQIAYFKWMFVTSSMVFLLHIVSFSLFVKKIYGDFDITYIFNGANCTFDKCFRSH